MPIWAIRRFWRSGVARIPADLRFAGVQRLAGEAGLCPGVFGDPVRGVQGADLGVPDGWPGGFDVPDQSVRGICAGGAPGVETRLQNFLSGSTPYR